MKAALALLTDRPVANAVSRLAWDVHRAHGTGLAVRRLPPHVSLKQPFDCPDIAAVEQFATEFARTIEPFEITLGGLGVTLMPEDRPTTGVLSYNVVETPALRALHNRLNHTLTLTFGPCPAPHDGDAYRFHLTVAMGGADADTYSRLPAAFAAAPIPQQFTVRELALFAYDKTPTGEWHYLTYAVLPLGDADVI